MKKLYAQVTGTPGEVWIGTFGDVPASVIDAAADQYAKIQEGYGKPVLRFRLKQGSDDLAFWEYRRNPAQGSHWYSLGLRAGVGATV